MHRPSTISHPTSEYEDELAWLDFSIEAAWIREQQWLDDGGIERMAEERGEHNDGN